MGGVVVHAHRERDDDARWTTSDVRGHFRFAPLPPGRWSVVAMGKGWQSASLGNRQSSSDSGYQALGAGDSTRVEILLVPAARAEGRVLDAKGDAVAGAAVWVDPNGFHGLLRDISSPGVITDREGRFAIETLVSGIHNRLRARHAGTADAWTNDFRPALEQVTRIDIVLPPERWLHATVVAEGDQPISGARISARRYREYTDGRWAWGRTDETGQARVGPLPPGALQVQVSAVGFLEVREVVTEDAIGRVLRDFALVPGHSISGHCVFADGTPASDMQVWATGRGQRDLGFTDEQGAFSLDDLTPGDWKIWIQPLVTATEHWTAKHVATVRAGTQDLTLTVDAGLTKPVRITVTDPMGQQVPLFEAVGDVRFGSREQENGAVRIPTGHSVKWLEIRGARTSAGMPLSLAPEIVGPLDDGRTELAVRLQHGLSIRGRIVGTGGVGVQGVEIEAWPEAKRPVDTFEGEHAVAVTNNDGAFSLLGLWNGTYRLQVTRKQPYADALDVTCQAGSEDVQIELRPSAQARVRIVDPGGRPVHDARLQVRRQGGRWIANPHSDRDGYFTLRGLDPRGAYRIHVQPPDTRPDLGELDLDAWRPAEERLSLPHALTISGRVVDSKGVAAKHAFVGARLVSAGRSEYKSAETEEDGTFVVGPLGEGTYRVRATQMRENADPLVATAFVAAGGRSVELALGAGVGLVAVLRNAPESIIGTGIALVGLRGERERRKATVTPEFTARFIVDPNTSYTLYRWLPEDGIVAMQDGIKGSAGQVIIGFQPSRSLRVCVIRPEEATRPEASLALGQLLRGPRVIAADSLEFQGLPPGTYTVSVWCQTRAGELRAEATGEAGESIEVVLR